MIFCAKKPYRDCIVELDNSTSVYYDVPSATLFSTRRCKLGRPVNAVNVGFRRKIGFITKNYF